MPRMFCQRKPGSTATRGSLVRRFIIFPFRLNNARTVYVEGLPFDATEIDVRSFFEGAGTVTAVRLPRWHDSGRLRGYGHVEFETVPQADLALDLNGDFL